MVCVKYDRSGDESFFEEEPDFEVGLHQVRLLRVEDPLAGRFWRSEEIKKRISLRKLGHQFSSLFVQFFDRLERHVPTLSPVDFAPATADHFRTVKGERQVGLRLALEEIFLRQNFVFEEGIFFVKPEVDSKNEMFFV